MSRFKNVAVMGTGAMGPGMGAVMARAGMTEYLKKYSIYVQC